MNSPAKLQLLPFQILSEGGGERLLGVAFAEAFALALCAVGFPVTVCPPNSESNSKEHQSSPSEELPADVYITGILEIGPYGEQLHLTLANDDGDLLARDCVDFAAASAGDELRRLSARLRQFGVGDGRLCGLAPSTFADIDLVARMIALELQTRSSATTPSETRNGILALVSQIRRRLDNPYVARMAREWVVVMGQLLQAARQAELQDAEGLIDSRGGISLPPGAQELLDLVGEGMERGDDKVAFLACRVATLHHLSFDSEAVLATEQLTQISPLDGWYWTARCLHAANRFNEAIDASDHALSISPAAPFRDVVRGLDAEPDPGGAQWRGVLLLVRGASESGAHRFKSAARSLRNAIALGADPVMARAYLVDAYRGWSCEEQKRNRRVRAYVLLHRQVTLLDEIFLIQRRINEVLVALQLADELNDLSLKRKWRDRQEALLAQPFTR